MENEIQNIEFKFNIFKLNQRICLISAKYLRISKAYCALWLFFKCIVAMKYCTKIEFVNSIDCVYIDISWAFL